MLFMTKTLERAFYSKIILAFVVHYMFVLAPEAVTELDYKQSNGSDTLIKITIKWMVSSQS